MATIDEIYSELFIQRMIERREQEWDELHCNVNRMRREFEMWQRYEHDVQDNEIPQNEQENILPSHSSE